jgi:hypothetical protein
VPAFLPPVGEKLLLAVFALLSLLGLANAFSLIVNSYDHNESLYLTAGWLMAHDHRLYVDFAFWQMPYSPLIYAAVFKIFQPENYLLTGKLVSFCFLLLSLVSLTGIIRQLGGRWWLALGLVAGLLGNITVIRCAMEASNYIMPIAFAFGGLWALIAAVQREKKRTLLIGVAGLLLALAVCTKLYYLPVALGIGLALLCARLETGLVPITKRLLLPFVLGFALGCLPVLPFMLRDPELFFLNNLGAHRYTTDWWQEVAAAYRASNVDPGLRITAAEKIRFTQTVVAEPGNLSLLVALLIGALALAKASCRPKPCWAVSLLLAAAFLCAWPAVFAPTPMWYQYLGTPVAFGIMLLGALLALLGQQQARPMTVLVCLWVAFTFYGLAGSLRQSLAQLSQPREWVAVALPKIARNLAERAPAVQGQNTRLLCLQQLMAIESGRWETYPELAYAPFTYVIAHRLPEALRLRAHFIGPQELPALLKQQPPAAVLTGLYDDGFWRDTSLDQWSQWAHYQSVTNPFGLRLLVPAKQP